MCLFNVYGCLLAGVFFFKQKTAYELRISDWSSDVCSSDLRGLARAGRPQQGKKLPVPRLDAHIVQRRVAAEALHDIGNGHSHRINAPALQWIRRTATRARTL